jgi:hypothetical protein
MAKPHDTAARLSVQERVLLFCLASGHRMGPGRRHRRDGGATPYAGLRRLAGRLSAAMDEEAARGILHNGDFLYYFSL